MTTNVMYEKQIYKFEYLTGFTGFRNTLFQGCMKMPADKLNQHTPRKSNAEGRCFEPDLLAMAATGKFDWWSGKLDLLLLLL
jgi:hypothetical protein